MISEILARRAVPGSSVTWIMDPGHPATCIADSMEQAGLITQLATCGWRLTESGLRSVRFLNIFNEPARPISLPRAHLAIEDRTTYELLHALRNDGWEWCSLPSKRLDRLAIEPYKVGAVKHYRTAGITTNKLYLQCLLRLDDLQERFQIDEIPHGQSDTVYSKLLKGVCWAQQRPAIEDAMRHPESDMPMLADGEVVDRDVEEQHNPGITFQTDGELEDSDGDGDGEQGGDVATPSHAPDRAGSTADRQDRKIADVDESLKAAVAALQKYWGVFTLSVKNQEACPEACMVESKQIVRFTLEMKSLDAGNILDSPMAQIHIDKLFSKP